MSQPLIEGDSLHRKADVLSRLARLEQAVGQNGSPPFPDDTTILDRLRRLEEKIGKPKDECVLKTDEIEIVTGTSNPQLARDIGTYLGKHPDDQAVTVFANGEPNIKISRNLRNKHVFIVQTVAPPDINRSMMELLMLIDTAQRSSADEITAVIPDYGFGRSDRKDQSRVPIAAALVANLIKTAGARRILTLDLHSPQTQGFFDGPLDNLFGSAVLLPQVQKDLPFPVVLTAPDAGAAKHAEKLSELYPLAEGTAIINKKRPKPNVSIAKGILGDVQGKTILFADNRIDTLGSLHNAAEMAMANGAVATYAMATHGYFSNVPATNTYPLELLDRSPLQRIWITDTVNHRPEVQNHPKIQIVSSAPLLAEAIKRIHTGGSLSELILQ